MTPPPALLDAAPTREVQTSRAVHDPKTPCKHCGLPLGSGWKSEFGAYCCNGCRAVSELLASNGLERYYQLKQGPTAPPPRLRPDGFAWLEQVLASSESATLDGGNDTARRIQLDVQGVHCAACIWLLEQLYRRRDGALDLRINPMQGKAELIWVPSRFDLADYLREAESFGYRFGPDRKDAPRQSRALVLRLYVCLAAAMNAQVFSICGYVGLGPQDGALFSLFGWLKLALGTLALLVGGTYFVRRAILGLRSGVVHLDLPIALGLVLAYAGSLLAHVLHGSEAGYFDTVATFIALMLLGRWMQERVLERNRRSLLDAEELDGLATRRRVEGRVEPVSVSALRAGDELWILPGELVPVAGASLDEHARIALDWITGESQQRGVTRGEALPAGAFNAGRSALRMAAAEDFSASRLRGLLGASALDPSRGDRRWNFVARAYVIGVLLLSSGGFLGWWLGSGFDAALKVAVSILVITCPCALGLAVPLAQELVQSSLRRRGIFVRNASFFGRALRVRRVIFDKTGTLTSGALELDADSAAQLAALAPRERAALHELVARSLHPVSRALAAALERDGGAILDASVHVEELPARGVEGTIGGRLYRLGRASFALGGPSSASATPRGTVFAVEGTELARFQFREQLEGDARTELGELQSEGLEVRMLSGDGAARVAEACARLGLDASLAEGELSPEQKAERIRSLDREDTLMVGDGLNDAPAFDAAWCSATPAIDRPQLPGRADFYFLGGGIAAVRRALIAARELDRTTRRALRFALIYNASAVLGCLLGWIGPLGAAVLMPVSSLALVLWTTLRIARRRQAWMS
ncbi:MAG: heavy metal translocating P-type ATPase [Planctomycetes bacterium]|nr:heavy metal translocating P-type ATPase [Planctomycetota bacterium]